MKYMKKAMKDMDIALQARLQARLKTAESLIEDLMGFVNVGDVRHYWQKKGEMAGCYAVINRGNRFMAEGRKSDGKQTED